MRKKKPSYWDVTIHVVDRPVDDEKYMTAKELKDEIAKCQLSAGVKITGIKIEKT